MTAPIDETAPPFDVADRIAAAVGGPVIVEDASFRVIGYSAFVGPMDRGRTEAILGRRMPEAWQEHLAETGSLDRLLTSTDVVDLHSGPWEAHRRLITAFRAGDRVLGVAWVAEADEPLGDGAAAALRRAVDEATPPLLRHLERVDAQEQHLSRLAATLLDGLPGAPAAADRLGLARDGRFVVLAAALDTDTSPSGAPAPADRVVEHLRRCLESFRRLGASTPRGDGALALVALAPEEADAAATRLGQDALRLAGNGSLRTLRVALSTVGAGLAALPRLRDEASSACAVASRGGAVVAYADVEAEVLVADLVATLPAGTGLRGIDRLREADRDRADADLERTLRAYLASCGSASATAEALGVHVTTVRHRLRRVTEVSGLRLDRPEVRTACELVLRLPAR
ncbi:helix-turn-helix domain-containing protein [Nocardioides flavescens]|uniref:helix-turn-helix domain-containing protein n=1 Tax=Nocardioides flavescens TaxID=2691959 RepID=UPI00136DD92D